jgi:hypothetical protein
MTTLTLEDGAPTTCPGLNRNCSSTRAASMISTSGQGFMRESTFKTETASNFNREPIFVEESRSQVLATTASAATTTTASLAARKTVSPNMPVGLPPFVSGNDDAKNADPVTDMQPWRTRRWTSDEDTKLKAALQTHDGKNWGAIVRRAMHAERKCGVWVDGVMS